MKLSVCIPTRNQKNILHRTINSINSNHGDKFEIVVLDDSDTFNENCIDYPHNVRHIKGGKKGFDVAVQTLCAEARGEFLWFMGDDVFHDGAIDCMLQIFEKFKDVEFFWVSSNEDPSSIASSNPIIDYYQDPDQFALKIGDQLGFVSALIIKKSLIDDFRNEDWVIQTQWMALYYALKAIGRSQKYAIVKSTLFASDPRFGPSAWYSVMKVFGVDMPRLYKHTHRAGWLKKKTVNTLIESNYRALVKTIFVGKATDSRYEYWKNVDYIKILFKEHRNFFFFYQYLILLIIPNVVCKYLYMVIKKLGYQTPRRFEV